MMLHGLHALMDQEYTGDINIMPSFRLANPLRLLSHLNEEELVRLTHHGERACYEKVEAIRRCTQISRTLEDILYRFEYGDLRPDPSTARKPRSSRRRPAPTRAQREKLGSLSDKVAQPIVSRSGRKVTKKGAGAAKVAQKPARVTH